MDALVAELDILRSAILRATLSTRWLRGIFVDRASRLLAFFLLSAALHFTLSLAAPVWMMALGPLILGVPHLFSGLRYLPKILSSARRERAQWLSKFIALVLFAVACLRLVHGGFVLRSGFLLRDGWEWIALGSVAVAFAFCYGFSLGVLSRFLILVPLALGSWYFPFQTASGLLLGHNFISFFFWIASTRNRQEKIVALLALGIFSVLSAAIITGFADPLLHFFVCVLPRVIASPSLGPILDPLMLATQVWPSQTNPAWLERALSTFAFGQAMHYFVWLKAVPEQDTKQEVPLSFTQSKRATVRDLGRPLAGTALAASLTMIIAIGFYHLGVLREIYIAASAAHGYVELAALPFLFKRNT
jgi:hypothetical protein